MAAAAKWTALLLLLLLLAAAGMAAGVQQVDCDIMVAGTCTHSLLFSSLSILFYLVSSISVLFVRFVSIIMSSAHWLPCVSQELYLAS